MSSGLAPMWAAMALYPRPRYPMSSRPTTRELQGYSTGLPRPSLGGLPPSCRLVHPLGFGMATTTAMASPRKPSSSSLHDRS